eukprot:1925181-Rhodomonas_salina.1
MTQIWCLSTLSASWCLPNSRYLLSDASQNLSSVVTVPTDAPSFRFTGVRCRFLMPSPTSLRNGNATHWSIRPSARQRCQIASL